MSFELFDLVRVKHKWGHDSRSNSSKAGLDDTMYYVRRTYLCLPPTGQDLSQGQIVKDMTEGQDFNQGQITRRLDLDDT